MRASQADRAIIAARATSSTRPIGSVGTDLRARALTEVPPYGYSGVRRHGNKRTAKGGSSTHGVNGMWRTVSPSQHRRDAVQIDGRWSVTVSQED